MKRVVLYILASAALLGFHGCIGELEMTGECCGFQEKVKVTFDVCPGSGPDVRSSVEASENLVRNINLYAYADGKLEQCCYSDLSGKISMDLKAGVIYEFYALANVGELSPPVDESALPSLCHSIGGPDDFMGCFPMSWMKSRVSVPETPFTVKVALERLVSKIRFSVDNGRLDGLRVRSVRLMQSALEVYPFAAVSGDVVGSAATLAGDCDYASEEDLEKLNSGQAVTFYALENCQGTLLPENDDEWAKNPDNIGDKAGLCTYMEVECAFEDGYMYDGNVIYRFYAGLDNTSNFDVVRNTDVTISLFVTGEGMRRLSWRVEPDVSVNPGYAYGHVVGGLHPVSDLYVGEVFEYEVVVDRQLLEDYGGNLEECSVHYVGSGGKACIEFGNIVSSPDNVSGIAAGRCMLPGNGEIWLLDADGKKIACLSGDAVVSRPYMSFLTGSKDGEEMLEDALTCEINGDERSVCIYMTDSSGRNLNSSDAYGYDLSLFDFGWQVVGTQYGIDDNIYGYVVDGVEKSGGYVAKIVYGVENDGYDAALNSAFVNSIFSSCEPATLEFYEIRCGRSREFELWLDYCPITITLVDNGWAKYHDTQLSLIVDNPSNIPLEISSWQIAKAPANVAVSGLVKTLQYQSYVLREDFIQYITSGYCNGEPDLYGKGVNLRCERTGNGDVYLEKGNLMVYPLYGISTSFVQACVKNNTNKSLASLHNLLDVQIDGWQLYAVNAVDNLEDGSPKYEIIYGSGGEYGGGWNNRGIWLYTDNLCMVKPETSLNAYRNLTPCNLSTMDELQRKGPMELTISYSDGYLYADVRNNTKGVSVDVSISGTVEGAVTTHPNGTWGAAKDNYCSKSFSGEKKGIALSGSRVRIDNGALKSAIDAVYATTYFDSKNWIGSSNNYQHSAHPTGITLKMSMKLSSGKPFSGMYPVVVNFNRGNVPYYHAQDNMTYDVAFGPSSDLSLFVRVQEN